MKVELSERELAYLSRAIFRHRTDKPEDEPDLAATLDPKISIARYRAQEAESPLADTPGDRLPTLAEIDGREPRTPDGAA